MLWDENLNYLRLEQQMRVIWRVLWQIVITFTVKC